MPNITKHLIRAHSQFHAVNADYIIGVLGLIFIALGWAISIKDIPPIKLTLPYLLGSVLLTVYSILEWNLVFIVLNAASALLSGINMIRGFIKLRKPYPTKHENN